MKRLLMLLLLIPSLSYGAAWYATDGWPHRIRLATDSSKVSGGADLSNFPMLVMLSADNRIKAAQADCDDILFTSGDGTTKLSHDIDTCDVANGNLIAWVKVPTLDYDATDFLWLYYGNASATSQRDRANVWTGYQIVMHMNTVQTTGSEDNSTDGTDGTYNPNVTWGDERVAGKIGYDWDHQRGSGTCAGGANNGLPCDDPNGSSNTADCANAGVCSFGGAVNGGASTDDKREFLDLNWGGGKTFGGTGGQDATFSYWVKVHSAAPIPCATKDMHFGFHSGYNKDGDSTRVRLYQRCVAANGGDDIAHRTDNDAAMTTTDNSLTMDTWHHVVLRVNSDATNNVATWLDGSNKGNGAFTTFSPDDNLYWGDMASAESRMEASGEGTTGMDGEIDELHVYLGVLSDGWIVTDYNSQNSPTTFYQTGGKEQRPRMVF